MANAPSSGPSDHLLPQGEKGRGVQRFRVLRIWNNDLTYDRAAGLDAVWRAQQEDHAHVHH